MKKSLNNKILERINQEGIQPKAKWQFILKEYLLWIGTALSLFLASISLGSFIFQSSNVLLLPQKFYAWSVVIRVLIIILFALFAVYQIMRTSKGYRRSYTIYVVIGLVVIGFIGSLLFASRLSGYLEVKAGRFGSTSLVKKHWSDPEKTGLLAGELIEVTNDGYILLKSLDDPLHVLDVKHLDEDAENLFIDYLRVQMVGYVSQGIYYPCVIQPWKLNQSAVELHKQYGKLQDGNIRFIKKEVDKTAFKKAFERKDEIVRSTKCS